MRRLMAMLAAVLLAQLCCAGQVNSADQWRQDIDTLVSGLSAAGTTVDCSRGIASRGQKDFAKLYPPATFQPAVAAVKDSVAGLSDSEIVLRLMQLMASAHVAHNIVQIPKGMGFERRLPISFGWFADGLTVIGATQTYTETIGLRVQNIGSLMPPQLLEAASPFLSHENHAWLYAIGPGFLELQPVLDHLRVLNPDGSVTVTLESAGHEPLVVKLSFAASQEARVNLWTALNITPPLFWPQPGKKYLSHYLQDSQTVYIQYNQCANDGSESFGAFTRSVMHEIDTHPVERVLIDLRWNGGGDSRVIAPLKKALASRPKLAGHIYVAMGQNTFSSALQNAIELKQELAAALVGEPAGGSPNGYGEVKTMTLPNSKLVVRYTSRYYSSPLSGTSLVPDILAPLTLHDVTSSHDPALAAILAK